MNNIQTQPEAEAFFTTATNLNDKGMGMYYWNAESAKAHLSPQSFTASPTLDAEFLVKPTVSFDGVKKIDTKDSYIQFQCLIEQRNDRTDNYTGRDPQDESMFISTLQFPGMKPFLRQWEQVKMEQKWLVELKERSRTIGDFGVKVT